MNFLAHSLFHLRNEQILVGQFCGDFVRGANLNEFPPDVREGIRLHREIDAFTDRHPAVVAERNGFEPPLRRFAGIVIDVVFDHCIARDWPRYSADTLQEHSEWVYDALDDHRHVLPGDLQRFSRYLRSNSVLQSNQSLSGIATTLERLSRRSSRFEPLAQAMPEVEARLPDLARCFQAFFPALDAHVTSSSQR